MWQVWVTGSWHAVHHQLPELDDWLLSSEVKEGSVRVQSPVLDLYAMYPHTWVDTANEEWISGLKSFGLLWVLVC